MSCKIEDIKRGVMEFIAPGKDMYSKLVEKGLIDNDKLTQYIRTGLKAKKADAINARFDEVLKGYEPEESKQLVKDAEEAVKEIKAKDAKTINIYSTEKNGYEKLSNLAPREFTYVGKKYHSVEHAYQTLKSGSFNQNIYDKYNEKYDKGLSLGKVIDPNSIVDTNESYTLMLDLLYDSITQNKDIKDLLLSTGDTRLTHTQEKGKWSELFPDALMEVRTRLIEERDAKPETPQKEQNTSTATGFQGYVGGFDSKGKGTTEGDGKDKAMRKVADGFVAEFADSEDYNNSTGTTRKVLGTNKDGTLTDNAEVDTKTGGNIKGKVFMLAKNGPKRYGKNKELANNLLEETKEWLLELHEDGATFVVGDMPGVDTQFIEYLNEIGASYKIYHTGATPRIDVTLKAGEDLPNQELTEAQVKAIEARNEAYLKANPDVKVVESNTYWWDNSAIQVVEGDTRANRAVYLAHELYHDKTAEWLRQNQNDTDVKKLQRLMDMVRDRLRKDIYSNNSDLVELLNERLRWDSGQKELGLLQENTAILLAEPNVQKALEEYVGKDRRNIVQKVMDKLKEYMFKTSEDRVNYDEIMKMVKKIERKSTKLAPVSTETMLETASPMELIEMAEQKKKC